MIWDLFLFNDELDMLECRLREFEGIPDVQHVLVESEVNFRGVSKSLHYQDNKNRFAEWSSRIMQLVAPLPWTDNPWQREFAARDFMSEGLAKAGPHDLVLLSDVDEIPTMAAVSEPRQFPTALQQRMSLYALEWIYPSPWRGTIASPRRFVSGLERLRDQRNHLSSVENAGWHLSWLGGESSHRKIDTTCHTEMTDQVKEDIRSGRFIRDGWHSDGTKLEFVPVSDLNWPTWVESRTCPESWFRP